MALPLKKYLAVNNYNSKICFLADMNLPSGRNRFFVYDLQKDSVILSGLVAHGSCDNGFQIGVSSPIKLTADVVAWVSSELEIVITEDSAWHISYMDLIRLIVMLIKELLFYIHMIVFLIRKFIHYQFAIAEDVPWFRQLFCKN